MQESLQRTPCIACPAGCALLEGAFAFMPILQMPEPKLLHRDKTCLMLATSF